MSTDRQPPYLYGSSRRANEGSGQPLADVQALPAYTRATNIVWDVPQVEQEHMFALHKRTGHTWLILRVLSRASSREEPPTFFQAGEVAGYVYSHGSPSLSPMVSCLDSELVALFGRRRAAQGEDNEVSAARQSTLDEWHQ